MNFLAHLLLSSTDSQIQFGNFVGDAIKGKQYLNLPIQIQKGVVLHRKIDSFTDQNPLIKKCKPYISPEIGHYKGVVTDLFFDHFLTINWKLYQSISLSDYLTQFEQTYHQHKSCLNQQTALFYDQFIQRRFLFDYDTFEGLERTLKGLERRTGTNIILSKAVSDLKDNYSIFETCYFTFFPILQTFCEKELQQVTHDDTAHDLE